MRWVTTITWFWAGLMLFTWGMVWILKQPGVCTDDAALGCGILALITLPAYAVFLVGAPVIFALWFARLGRWLTHRPPHTPPPSEQAASSTPAPAQKYTITGRPIR